MSGWLVRRDASTRIPSSTFNPAARAGSTFGSTPTPATTPSTATPCSFPPRSSWIFRVGLSLLPSPPQVERPSKFFVIAPDALQGLVLPESLGERGGVVGHVRLGPDEPDRPGTVDLPDSVRRRVGGHAAPDNQILVARHGPIPLEILFAPYGRGRSFGVGLGAGLGAGLAAGAGFGAGGSADIPLVCACWYRCWRSRCSAS